MAPNKPIALLSSVIATGVFSVAWLVSTIVAHAFVVLMGTRYGEGPTYLTMLLAAGFSGYIGAALAAMLINEVFKTYWKKFIFWSFGLIILLITLLGLSEDIDHEKYFHAFTALITSVAALFSSYRVLILEQEAF